MAILLNNRPAEGGPGIPPRWTRSDKDAVGTAYSSLSEIWYTISNGALDEIYYPTVDHPQVRDLQLLVGDGETFVLGERRMTVSYEQLGDRALGFAIELDDPLGRFRLRKEVLAAPYQPCLLLRVRLEAPASLLSKLHLYALLAPHLEVSGRDNYGNVVRTSAGAVLTAHKEKTWLALGATSPFLRCSCGYVGTTDGWQDLTANFRMTHMFDSAGPGNLALLGEIDLRGGKEFVLGLAFGDSLSHALVELTQSLGMPFDEHKAAFIEQWQGTAGHLEKGPTTAGGDGGHLARLSTSVILAHEDKRFDGALIASLSIPWGQTRDDDDMGGYHLVWTRDLYNSATGLLAAGEKSVPLRTLIYLSCVQRDDGGFWQNTWIDGEPYWRGVQLDESAFPILLAWHLRRADALKLFDPLPLVRRAAGYLVRSGPVTPQDRWEEDSGYSPSTLAAVIAGLICAASLIREQGDEADAVFLEEQADFLEARLDRWTVTEEGTLVAGIPRHYVRMRPADPAAPPPIDGPPMGLLSIRNVKPGQPSQFPARDVVDAGFLELVRYGVRRPDDPLIVDSLRVVDAVLAVDFPAGRCWRRYNHDGYGQRADGEPFVGWGLGHAWPVLTGERGHYELAAGRDARPFLRTMEGLATPTGLIPEQVWSLPDEPEALLRFGHPTSGANPLVWAHGEYLKLARSVADGRVFDRVPEVASRYEKPRAAGLGEIWRFSRQTAVMCAGGKLRIQAAVAFRLHWSLNEWARTKDTLSTTTRLGVSYVDIEVPADQKVPIRFTFYWVDYGNWEGKDFQVGIDSPPGRPGVTAPAGSTVEPISVQAATAPVDTRSS